MKRVLIIDAWPDLSALEEKMFLKIDKDFRIKTLKQIRLPQDIERIITCQVIFMDIPTVRLLLPELFRFIPPLTVKIGTSGDMEEFSLRSQFDFFITKPFSFCSFQKVEALWESV